MWSSCICIKQSAQRKKRKRNVSFRAGSGWCCETTTDRKQVETRLSEGTFEKTMYNVLIWCPEQMIDHKWGVALEWRKGWFRTVWCVVFFVDREIFDDTCDSRWGISYLIALLGLYSVMIKFLHWTTDHLLVQEQPQMTKVLETGEDHDRDVAVAVAVSGWELSIPCLYSIMSRHWLRTVVTRTNRLAMILSCSCNIKVRQKSKTYH